MSQPSFAPKITQPGTPDAAAASHSTSKKDTTSRSLLSLSHWIIIVFAGLLPVFFLPGLWGSLGFQKIMLAMGAIGAVVILASLLALRSRAVVSTVPMSLVLFWGVVLSAVVAALFSPDWLNAFRGEVVETQSVTFLVLLAGLMTVTLMMQRAKKATLSLFAALAIGALTLLVYTVTRLVFGPILSFSSFSAVTVSPLGNFNDLAVFSGLAIILGLIALLQLRTTVYIQAGLITLVTLALFVMMAVNFFYIWLAVGFFALLVLLYLISHDTLFANTEESKTYKPVPKLAFGITALVCIVSGAFVVAGDQFGGAVSRALEVDYLEVRPSLGATVDILQSTYQEDLLFGAGPNQFTSSWRLFKDPSINQTVFWNTDFKSGSGYIPTLFINLGLIGSIMVVGFHLWYLSSGLRMLLRPVSTDRFWYFIGLLSFTGAVFLWAVSYVYIPSASLLLLAALLTGVSLASGGTLQPQRAVTIPLAANQQRGFVLMALAIVFISTTMGAWFSYGKQYVAQASFAQAQAAESDFAALDQAALSSFSLYPDDVFLGIRARLAFLEMNEILGIAEPTEVDQQRFLEVSDQAVTLAAAAVNQTPSEPSHHAILAAIYNSLAVVGVEDAVQRVSTSLATAQALDPQNPTYSLLTAQYAASRGDIEASRSALAEALQQKSNFAEALYLLAQLDIEAGNAESAIATTQAIIRLEPNNPTRYYQLGILESSAGNVVAAKEAYEAAIRLDPEFANSRYLLAILQIAEGETDLALNNLRFIQAANADNSQLQELITSLEAGEVPSLVESIPEPVNENQPVLLDDDVTSTVVPESDLLTPLNSVGEQAPEEPVLDDVTPELEPADATPVESTEDQSENNSPEVTE